MRPVGANVEVDKVTVSDGITGVVLAGGRGTRMGGQDKGLVPIAGKPMARWVLERLRPQVQALRINANRSCEEYERWGVPVDGDEHPDYPGPLAGIATALRCSLTDRVCVVPCDAPLLPADTVARLQAAMEGAAADLAVARANGRLQPVFMLLQRRLLGDLEGFLAEGGRKIDQWYGRLAVAEADFEDEAERLVNVNTPEERDAVEQALAE